MVLAACWCSGRTHCAKVDQMRRHLLGFAVGTRNCSRLRALRYGNGKTDMATFTEKTE